MKVSVVVPTYNQARYLPMTLDSIWFQDYPDIEIVVVNDCSPDDTAQAIEDYLHAVESEMTSYASDLDEATGEVKRVYHRRYPPQGRAIKVLTHEGNQGLSAALNTGFSAATGELCTFIASDDMLLPTMVSDLARLLEETGADFAYADQHIVDDQGRILRRFTLPDYTFEDAFCHWYLCGVGKLYKRSLHERFGLFREDLTVQDHEMYQRFAINGAKFVHCPKVLVNLRIHDKDRLVDNHTPQNKARLYRESSDLVRIARDHLARGRG